MTEKLFKLKENHTDVKTEIMAGVSTFMTMAYILAINPSILGRTGMDPTAVLLATCIASVIGTVCMGLMANLPFVLSAGMGLNAYMAYTVVAGYGYPWQVALLAVFVEGIVFIVLSLTNVREAIFNAIPVVLKKAVSVGIGLYIAFIGLQNAGLCVDSSATLVTITGFRKNFTTSGICALLTIVGLYVPDAESGYNSLFPTMSLTDFSKLGETFGQCFKVDMHSIGIFNFIVVVFSFLFVDLFDTLGTLIGVCSKADMLDEKGRLPQIKPALLADAVATTAGAVLGTSTTTTFVESSAGVAAGGRTGLTSITAAVLFALSMFFAPIFTAIPSFATAPALIVVGFLMFSSITDIKFDDGNYTKAIPAYLCILSMPLFYSISEGISLGIISYVVINLVCGKRKDITPLMYVLAVLFVLKYVFL